MQTCKRWGCTELPWNLGNYQNWVPSIRSMAIGHSLFEQIFGIFPWVSRINYFSLFPRISVKIYRVVWMGLNFYDNSGFKPKITHPKHYPGEFMYSIFNKEVFTNYVNMFLAFFDHIPTLVCNSKHLGYHPYVIT